MTWHGMDTRQDMARDCTAWPRGDDSACIHAHAGPFNKRLREEDRKGLVAKWFPFLKLFLLALYDCLGLAQACVAHACVIV